MLTQLDTYLKNRCRKVLPLTDDCLDSTSCPCTAVINDRCVLHCDKSDQDWRALGPLWYTHKRSFETLLDELQHEPEWKKVIDFRAVVFPSSWEFDGVFDRRVTFEEAEFYGTVDFRFCGFTGGANFTKTKFLGTATFFGASFWDGISKPDDAFYRTEFHQSSDFRETVFPPGEKFIECQFTGEVDFSEAKIVDGRIEKCAFGAGARFSPYFRHGESPMVGRTSWAAFFDLRFVEKGHLVLTSLTLEETDFGSTDLEQIDFQYVLWSRAPGGNSLLGERRRVLSAERGLAAPARNDNQAAEKYRLTCEILSQSYRKLVLVHEKKRDYEAAEEFHIGEMEMRRRLAGGPINSYSLYRFLSNYGTSYRRALAVLVALGLAIAASFFISGFRIEGPEDRSLNYDLFPLRLPDLAQWLSDFGNAALYVLSILTLQRDRLYSPSNPLTQLLQGVGSIVLTAQSALVLLAIRRKFKR